MPARVLALLIHAVTLAMVVGAAVLWFSPVWIVFKVALGALLLALAWQVRPRPLPAPAGTVLDRATAPVLFGVLDRIASAGSIPAPRQCVLDPTTRATSGRAGGGTYVAVGWPLWATCPPQFRVALLAEQAGRLASGASLVDPLVVSAQQTLDDWRYFFHPSAREARRRLDVSTTHFLFGAGDEFSYSDLLLPVLFAPVYATVSALRALLVRLARHDLATGMEHGRAVAATVAGPAALEALAGAQRAATDALAAMERASRLDPRADLSALAMPVEDVPAGAVPLTPTEAAALDDEIRQAAGPVLRSVRDLARA